MFNIDNIEYRTSEWCKSVTMTPFMTCGGNNLNQSSKNEIDEWIYNICGEK